MRYKSVWHLASVLDRLLEIVLPQGGYVALFEAYMDESGCDEGSKVLCVAGYLLRSDFARDMTWRWRQVLSTHNLPYFHMVDCAHGAEEFKRLDKDERIAVASSCIDLIKKYTLLGLAVIVKPSQFMDNPDLPDPYTFCLDMCAVNMLAHMKTRNTAEAHKVAIFFETGHENASKAHAYFEQRKNDPNYASHTFAKKEDVCLLQAADLLAWQAAKHVKNMVFSERSPRKDFLSLMQHPYKHWFIYAELSGSQLKYDINPLIDNVRMKEYITAMFSGGEEAQAILSRLNETPLGRRVESLGSKTPS